MLITRIWIGQNSSTASCTACPPWREVRPRERFRSWECEASSHRFSINGLLPQKRREDACALQKSRRLRDETQRAEICAGCENFHGSDFTKDSRCPFSTAERHRDYYGPVFARDNATFFSKSSHWLHRSTRWRSQIRAAESRLPEV